MKIVFGSAVRNSAALLLFFVCASAGLAASPALTPEFNIDLPVYTNIADAQATPVASWNGECFLTVWVETRESVTSIRGARVSTNGVLLDNGGLTIAADPTEKSEPAISWGGTNWLVVWTEEIENVNRLRATRVSEAGVVMDANSLEVCANTAAQRNAAVSWNGVNWLVVWEDFRASGTYVPHIFGMRVTPQGNMLDGNGLAISDADAVLRDPDVAWGGTSWLVVWLRDNSGPRLYGGRVMPDGSLLDTSEGFNFEAPLGTGLASKPRAAWGQANWLVAWVDGRHDADNANIVAMFVNEDGSVTGNAGNPHIICDANGPQTNVSLAWGQTNWVAVWSDFRSGPNSPEIYAGRVNNEGVCLDGDDGNGFVPFTANHIKTATAISRGEEHWLVAWQGECDGRDTVFGSRMAWETNVLDKAGFMLGTTANFQTGPASAWNGTNWLVVWSDSRLGSADIYGARVDAMTNLLDPAGFLICAAAGAQENPIAAWGGTNWLVMWEDHGANPVEMRGARVSAGAQVLNPNGEVLAVSTGDQLTPAASWGGTNWLVAWADHREGGPRAYGARVDKGMRVLDAGGFALCAQASNQKNPAVAWGRTNWLVAWEDYRAGVADPGIFATRVNPAGTVLDGTGMAVCTAANIQAGPALAWGRTNWLAAWQDLRSSDDYDIYCGRISRAGTTLDGQGVVLCSAAKDQASVYLGWNQTNWFAVWRDARHEDDSGIAVYGGRISAAASPLDGNGTIIAGPGTGEMLPNANFGLNGRALVTWSLADTRFGSDRAQARFWQEPWATAAPAFYGVNSALVTSGAPATASAGTDFGVFELGVAASTNVFTITNSGNLFLDITTVAVTGPGAAAFQIGSTPNTLPAGTGAKLKISFDPSALGEHNATLALENTSQTTPYLVNLRGRVIKRAQSITFPAIPEQTATSRVSLAATASSGLPVSFAVASGPGHITDATNLSFIGSGAVRVVASQAGNAQYQPAPALTNSVLASKAAQSITFPAIPEQTATSRVSLAATASSGLPVSFAVASGPGHITDATNLTFTGTGVVSIAATQSGNEMFEAAPEIVRSFTVTGVDKKDPAHPGDYSGEGFGDMVIFDFNTGFWYIRTLDGRLVAWAEQWGWPGAWPVAGDFNGDGRYDLAVFDTNTGHWYIRTLDGALLAWAEQWGWPGAWPVSGDYNGDATSDLAVFDTNTGHWYIKTLDGELLAWAEQWGWPGAYPVPGDYDADGRFDLAVFDTNTGHWYIKTLDGELLAWAEQWGWPGAYPVPGDYDADGRFDLAVFDTNTGHWYIRTLDGTLLAWAEQWGWPGARPVAGDYDADGRFDLAVFDTNTGHWYIRTLDGTLLAWAEQWGWPGAWPLSAFAW